MTLNLRSSLDSVPGIGPKTLPKLSAADFHTVGDLLEHYPKKHRIYQHTTAKDAKPGDYVILHGHLSAPFSKKTNRISTQTSTLKDDSGSITLRWFNQPYLARSISPNAAYEVRGRVEVFNRQKQIVAPQLTKTNNPAATHLSPLYPQAGDLNTKWFTRHIKKILEILQITKDPLPNSVRREYNLLDKHTALNQIHFPSDFQLFESALHTLSFEELYLLQLNALSKKHAKKSPSTPLKFPQTKIDTFIKNLDFQLTPSQLTSAKEILTDLTEPLAMQRLLMGDVGSGKTIVAVMAGLATHLAGKKVLVMAPTQVLAEQLHANFHELLPDLKVKLITGQHKPSGEFDILVGTHALLNQIFDNIGLVIIDEQHKFGVSQRDLLTKSSIAPHLLTMTATPIPRTFALSALAHLDVSALTDMPAGRKAVKTYLVPNAKRESSIVWIKQHIKEKGYKVFIVAPLIDDSEHAKFQHLRSATSIHKEIKQSFPEFSTALIHGKLKEEEKTHLIADFKSGDLNILIATTVIEVGIDAPEANIMIIESAERFGLSTLHQLRGRVGRRTDQGYCLLFTSKLSEKAQTRLKYFTHHTDGAKLAELDMQLRGPGELSGTLQHGFLALRLASIHDHELVKITHAAALSTLANMPNPD